MELEYKGANAITIATKNTKAVIDPKLSLDGLKDMGVKGSVVISTSQDYIVSGGERLLIDGPGEYEIGDFSIKGIPAVRHVDVGSSEKKATIYRIEVANTRIAVIGHVNAQLSDEQLEQLGIIDIFVVPVGGSGYTLDAHDAAALVRRVGPKVVVPTHYADEAISYQVPQSNLDLFVKELSAPHETVAKLKVKNGALPEVLTLIEVTRTS